MRDPGNIQPQRPRCRMIKGAAVALVYFCTLTFSSLGVWAIEMPAIATQPASGSISLAVNLPIQAPADNHHDPVVANAKAAPQSLTPVPEISVLFPILGLVAAIAVTQLLRRRRISQQRSASTNGR